MSIDGPKAVTGLGAATKLQILATEHWSLLATRSLTYTEALNRVTIFLAILSGAVIALALVAQADRFGPAFIGIAIPMLAVVLLSGVATVSRLNALNRDDHRWIVGMNRLRHGYLELHPELEPFFTTSQFDDLGGALQTLGIEDLSVARGLGSSLHLFQTLPGMLILVVAGVAGAIGALAALALGSSPAVTGLSAGAGFALVVGWFGIQGRRAVTRSSPSLEPRFPSPRG